MYLDVRYSNGPLLRLLVNLYEIIFLNRKIEFHFSILNAVRNKTMTQVYVLFILGYLCFILYEYSSKVINVYGNGLFKNN